MKKKYQIKELGNGIFEVIVSAWVWSNRLHLIRALEKIAVDNIVTAIYRVTAWNTHYIICTMPKQK